MFLLSSAPWKAPSHCLLPSTVSGEMSESENEPHKSTLKTYFIDAFLTNENKQLENWRGLWDLEIRNFLLMGL